MEPVRGIPLGRGLALPVWGPAGADEALLLVGHGSRCRHSRAELVELGRQVAAARPELAVGVGFLELSDPPAGPVLDELVARGARRVVVLPLMLLGAGHAKNDMPAVVLEARERHPGVDLRYGAPLGVVSGLVELAGRRVEAAGLRGAPLLVLARGTSDPDANAEAARAGRLVAEWTAAPYVHSGFTGVTWPLVPDALAQCAALGLERLGVFFWFLAYGTLIERAREDVARARAAHGIEIVDAGWFGVDGVLVTTVLERYRGALAGAVPVNCDMCVYRRPWPGLEDRIGQERGHGHSHLAAEHRAHGRAGHVRADGDHADGGGDHADGG